MCNGENCVDLGTNLTMSRIEVHRRGSGVQAIRASVAIPGELPPVPYEGDLLVDREVSQVGYDDSVEAIRSWVGLRPWCDGAA